MLAKTYGHSTLVDVKNIYFRYILTLSPPSTTRVAYKTAWIWMRRQVIRLSSRSRLFDTHTTFSQTLSDIEALLKFKQTRNLADINLFGRLRVNEVQKAQWELSALLKSCIKKSPVFSERFTYFLQWLGLQIRCVFLCL